MIPDRNTLLAEAVRIINASGSGLLTTLHPVHGPHVWIGLPVLTGDARRLVSFIPEGSDLLGTLGPRTRLTWRFMGDSDRLLLAVEGSAHVIASPVPRQMPAGSCATTHPPGTIPVVTEVESLLLNLPQDRVTCRVVLPRRGGREAHPAIERAKRLIGSRETAEAQLRLPF